MNDIVYCGMIAGLFVLCELYTRFSARL